MARWAQFPWIFCGKHFGSETVYFAVAERWLQNGIIAVLLRNFK
jgi:hypothetical protein